MDGICSAVLDKIFALGAPGRNIVISEDEFFEAFPEDCVKSEGELRKALKTLASGGYIDIKYAGGDLYCVTPIKNRVIEEPPAPVYTPSAETLKPQEYTLKYSTLPAFLAALAGSALGSTVIALIFYFI